MPATRRSGCQEKRLSSPFMSPNPSGRAACDLSPHPSSIRLVEISETTARGIDDLRRPPDVVGRVGRPAHPGERLAAVVVRGTLAGKTMRIPPVQQAAAVRVPASCRLQPMREPLRGCLGTPTLTTKYLTRQDQGEHD